MFFLFARLDLHEHTYLSILITIPQVRFEVKKLQHFVSCISNLN